jgi:hypothetical protein
VLTRLNPAMASLALTSAAMAKASMFDVFMTYSISLLCDDWLLTIERP